MSTHHRLIELSIISIGSVEVLKRFWNEKEIDVIGTPPSPTDGIASRDEPRTTISAPALQERRQISRRQRHFRRFASAALSVLMLGVWVSNPSTPYDRREGMARE